MKTFEAKNISDYKFISSLFNSNNTEYLLIKNISAQDIKDDHSDFKKYFIVSDKGVNIGYYNIYLSPDKKISRVGLVVNKPYQGIGFGAKIMKVIETKAKKYGVRKLKLDVMVDNVRVVNLYLKMGYKETHRLLYMEKSI